MSNNTIAFVTALNIFLFLSAVIKLLQRKHIINYLLAFSAACLIVLELGKLSLLFDLEVTDKLIGFGWCLTPLFWLIASVSLIPSKSYSLSRVVLSPLFALFSLVFFLAWWIKPFMSGIELEGAIAFSSLARYFFVLMIFALSLVISNIERSLYYFKQRHLRYLFLASLFLLGPYIFLATYSVIIAEIKSSWIAYSSFSVFAGAVLFLLSSNRDFSIDAGREDTAVHTSVSLFLIGGYLFFVGGFIKIFQAFGWNLNVLFSLLTTLFVVMTLLFLMSSGSFRERLRMALLRNLTRQKYDWQKVWSEFTYKVSLVTEMSQITGRIKEAIAKIIQVKRVEVVVFEAQLPFEEEFADWLLRYAGPLSRDEFLSNDTSAKYPLACKFFKDNEFGMISPLYGEKNIIGVIGIELTGDDLNYFDKELLKVLSLQASSAIISCRSYQKMAEAQKKESLYKLSSFIIHDIKNYINSLSLLIANKDKFNNQGFLDDALLTLENTIGKMNRMMEEFKALRGDLALAKKPYLLRELVDESLRDIGAERLEAIEIVRSIEENAAVEADPYYLNRVLFNIIGNALDAMKQKGTLALSTERAHNDITLVVSDSGCGMSKEFIETKLFKPFTSSKRGGLGIGLYQCKTIIEAHAGSIEVESEEGKGTAFRITLPAAAGVLVDKKVR